jgi:hypothetical protein
MCLAPCRLIRLLDIDLTWRLNKVSDGQRRRVQICMGLLKPYQVRKGGWVGGWVGGCPQ